MKSQLWYNIKFLFFPKKKTSIFDVSRGESKKKYFKDSFSGKFPSKNLFENKNDKNSFLFSETFSTNKINNDYFIRTSKNSHIGYSFPKLFFLTKSLKTTKIVKSCMLLKIINKKYFRINIENFFLSESEIIINWNLNFNISNPKKFNQKFCILNGKAYMIGLLYENLFCFYLKEKNTIDLFIEGKKLRFMVSIMSFKILSDIKSQASNTSSPYNFLIISLRLIPKENYCVRISNFLLVFFFKIISSEGTNFLNTGLSLQFEKINNLKKIFNKITDFKIKSLFQKFSELLIQKKYQQEFIIYSLGKIVSEKKTIGNLLLIFKCLLTIQQKIQVNCTSMVLFNMVTLFKENLDILLKFDDFFHSELQFLPLNCISIDKEIYFSFLKKEKEYKESFNSFFYGAFKRLNYQVYLSFYLNKILSKILKKHQYFVKISLIEVVFKTIKKIDMHFFPNKKKNVRIIKRHSFFILKECDIRRFFFLTKKKMDF